MWTDKPFKPYLQTEMPQEQTLEDQNGFSKILMLEPGFSFIYTENHFDQQREVVSNSNFPEPILVVTVALQGQSWYEPEGAEAMQFVQGYTTISRFMRCNGQRRYPAKSTVRQVRLSINRSWFESHLGETYSKQFFGEEGGVKVLSQQPTTVSTLHIAKRLASLSLEEALNRLELHSLAISLVRSELGLLLKSLDSKDDLAMFSPQEQQRIQQLRSWMQQNCHLALTVADLAKQAGINEHKLKQGFQVIFQQSPYQLLTELRMAKAYELLLNSEMSVDQIAEAVGYRHGSNFSAAFKKYFELSPGQVKKAQKTEQGLSFLPPP